MISAPSTRYIKCGFIFRIMKDIIASKILKTTETNRLGICNDFRIG